MPEVRLEELTFNQAIGLWSDFTDRACVLGDQPSKGGSYRDDGGWFFVNVRGAYVYVKDDGDLYAVETDDDENVTIGDRLDADCMN